jgi:Integrase core domain
MAYSIVDHAIGESGDQARCRQSEPCGRSRREFLKTVAVLAIGPSDIPGHWEGDLLRGARNSHVATLVERHSRFCMLVKVPGKDTTTVVAALSRHVRTLPATLRRSLTWDRGLEMAQHKSFTMATDVQVYFCESPKPMAARFERKHERAAAAIPTEEGGSALLLTVGPGRDRPAPQSTATKNIGI